MSDADRIALAMTRLVEVILEQPAALDAAKEGK
jgi:hypothetical protein